MVFRDWLDPGGKTFERVSGNFDLIVLVAAMWSISGWFWWRELERA